MSCRSDENDDSNDVDVSVPCINACQIESHLLSFCSWLLQFSSSSSSLATCCNFSSFPCVTRRRRRSVAIDFPAGITNCIPTPTREADEVGEMHYSLDFHELHEGGKNGSPLSRSFRRLTRKVLSSFLCQ